MNPAPAPRPPAGSVSPARGQQQPAQQPVHRTSQQLHENQRRAGDGPARRADPDTRLAPDEASTPDGVNTDAARDVPEGSGRRQPHGGGDRRRARHDGARHIYVTRVPLWKRAQRWVMLLTFLLMAELIAAALTSPHFAVVAVDVMGTEITPLDAVHPVQTALVGQNWIRARTAQAARELETLPPVRMANVVRVMDWPPRLAINITERKPFARVGAGAHWWVVDEQGVPFRTATARDGALHAITGPRLQPALGRPLPAQAWRPVTEFAAALAHDQQHGGRWDLRRVYIDKHGYASLRLTGGSHNEMLVQLGMDHWPEKLRRARQALVFFEETGRRAATLNLVSFTMPTWTPRQASDTTSSVTMPPPVRSG